MKLNCLAFLGAMISTSLLAQQITNAPPASPATPEPAPAPATTAAAPALTNAPVPAKPAAKSGRKKSATKKKSAAAAKKKDAASELKTVPLVPGPAVVDANHVNVRGQPRLKSEVLTRLDKGQPVTVLEEIVRNNSAADEPSAWAKILLPTNAHAWVHNSFVDATSKTVIPRKLNVRSGPGENYSVIGQLRRGEPVTELGVKGVWTEIQPPTNAYAFIAAEFLKQEAPAPTPAPPPTEVAAQAPEEHTEVAAQTPEESAKVTEPPAVAAAPTEPPPVPPTPAPTEPVATNTNQPAETAVAAAPVAPPVEEPPPKRIVEREGIVRGTVSIQAPTRFGLYSEQNGRIIDYLYTSSPELDLRRYKGLHIIVTGEEGLDERWGNAPIVTIQKIQVLED